MSHQYRRQLPDLQLLGGRLLALAVRTVVPLLQLLFAGERAQTVVQVHRLGLLAPAAADRLVLRPQFLARALVAQMQRGRIPIDGNVYGTGVNGMQGRRLAAKLAAAERIAAGRRRSARRWRRGIRTTDGDGVPRRQLGRRCAAAGLAAGGRCLAQERLIVARYLAAAAELGPGAEGAHATALGDGAQRERELVAERVVAVSE